MSGAPNTYAAYAKNDNIRLESSSGGIFTVLAEIVLRMGGSVYGVKMSDDCSRAEYARVTELVGLDALKGSKYLQAYIGDTYSVVKKDLEAGIPVLFSGTGCLVNGLKGYLRKEYDNLYCVDVICHGVPSPELWKRYVEYINRKYNSELISVNFRSKKRGWKNFRIKKIDDRKKEIYVSKDVDLYMQMFLKNTCLRPSCYECVAKNEKKADLTIADFWGIENVAPEMDDGNGTSLVIARTEKGIRLFESITEDVTVKEVAYEAGVRGNSAESRSANRPEERTQFFVDMNRMQFDELGKKYVKNSQLIKQKIRIMLRPVKRCIKSGLHIMMVKTRRGVKLYSHSSYGILLTVQIKER